MCVMDDYRIPERAKVELNNGNEEPSNPANEAPLHLSQRTQRRQQK